MAIVPVTPITANTLYNFLIINLAFPGTNYIYAANSDFIIKTKRILYILTYKCYKFLAYILILFNLVHILLYYCLYKHFPKVCPHTVQ